MLREIVEIVEKQKYTIKYSTSPNGHFGGEMSLSKADFNKALKMDTSGPRTENGFNTYKLQGTTLVLGYNHRRIWKSFE